MIKFKEVIEFIEKEKSVFEKFSKEVANATKVNKSILSSNEVSEIYMKRAYRKVDADLFKKDSYRAAPREIFIDLLVNGYNTIKSGKRFQITKKDFEAELTNINLTTKDEKLAYLASLYTMLYDYEYTKSFYLHKLEEYLIEKKMLVFKFDIENMANILEQEINIRDNGKQYGIYYDIEEIWGIKNSNYLTGAQFGDRYERIRMKIDKLENYISEKENYEEIKDKFDYKRIFPKTLQDKIQEVIKKPPVPKMLTNVSNEFALKTLYRSMPDKLNEVVYKNFKVGVQNDEQNEKLDDDEVELLCAKLLVDKYSYKEVESLGEYWASPKKLINIDIATNTKYKKMYEVDTDVINEYIKKYQSSYQTRGSGNLINFLFLMVILYNQKEDLLKKTVKDTKEEFEKMLIEILGDAKDLMKFYTPRNIKTKKLFKKLLPHLNEYYFNQSTAQFRAYPKELREQICKTYLNTMVLENSVYERGYGASYSQEELKRDASMEHVIKEIAEIFEFDRR